MGKIVVRVLTVVAALAIVALIASNDFYIGFKLWGLMGMTFAFMIIQFIVLRRYVRQDSDTQSDSASEPKSNGDKHGQ